MVHNNKVKLATKKTCKNFSPQIKKQQQRINMILSVKNVDYEAIDIAVSEEAKLKMRDLIGDPKVLPPQLFNDDQYCGVSSFMTL